MSHEEPQGIPMLHELYDEILETRPSVNRWQPSRIDWFVSAKDWDGYVDFNNNRLVIEEEGKFRTSVRHGSDHEETTFDTATEAMAHLDICREKARRFILYKMETDPGLLSHDSNNGNIIAVGILFWRGMCVVNYSEPAQEVRIFASMSEMAKKLPEDIRPAWIDPSTGPVFISYPETPEEAPESEDP